MSKKNLDELFQEKFEDFSDIPTENVWKSIESSLDKKKKNRKVIPIWWKLGGIAALLAIGLFLANPFKDGTETNEITTDIEHTEKNSQEQRTNEGLIKSTPEITDTNSSENESMEESSISGVTEKEGNIDLQKSLNSDNHNRVIVEKRSGQKTIDKSTQKDKSILIAVTEEKSDKQDKGIDIQKKFENRTDSGIAQSSDNPNKLDSEQVLIKNGPENKEKNAIISENINTDQGIAKNDAENSESIEEPNKKSILDEILTESKEETIAEKSSKNKWSAGPSIAPVYFNGMGEGSPVHSIFVPNSKSGDVNLSYGLAVSYEISNKLSVKTGIHKVDLGYNTNDVEFSSSLASFGNGQIENIDYSSDSRNIVVESGVNKASSFAESKTSDFTAKDASLNGVMAQQFGYLEIPLELNYSLVDRKLGLDLVGGFSSLFLIDNSVTLSSGDLITEMGKANNINTINFSTNIGLGINYNFTNKLRFNVEPMFKYQLNTFSDTSGDFRPFTIGIYSGLNFRF